MSKKIVVKKVVESESDSDVFDIPVTDQRQLFDNEENDVEMNQEEEEKAKYEVYLDTLQTEYDSCPL